MVGGIVACGGSSDGGATTASTSVAPPVTATATPEAQIAPRTAPPPKPTTTTTTIPTPDGFPEDLPLPEGAVGYYTGSPDLGFHLNISTSMKLSEIVEFFTTAIGESDSWSLSVRDLGQGFLPGYTEQWAIFSGPDHVVTQLAGEFPGAIEVMGRHLNILLDPPDQPLPGVEPELLPSLEELPRPTTAIESVRYTSGLVQTTYATADREYEDLIDAYRQREWREIVVNDYDTPGGIRIAAGVIAGWKVTATDDPDSGLKINFEKLALSFP